MKILRPIDIEQNLLILPREYHENVSLVLSNEAENTQQTINLTTTTESGYMKLSHIFDLYNETFYNFEVFGNDKLIHRGRIYVTEQVLSKFEMNNDLYSYDNLNVEYIYSEQEGQNTFINTLDATLDFTL